MLTLAEVERLTKPRNPELSDIRNFLLLQYPLALGTAVHATPLIAAIHEAIPEARVTAAASGFALQILRNNPLLERVVATPSPLTEFVTSVLALRKANLFGRERYAVLLTTGNERSRILFASVLGCSSSTRVGFTLKPELSRETLSFDARLSQIANNLRIVEALGHGSSLLEQLRADPALLEPQVFPDDGNDAAAHDLLAGQGIDEAKPIAVFITQTSPTQRKSWRAERFQQVAVMLRDEYGMQIVFAGAAAEAAAIDTLRSGIPFPTANIAGRTGLLDLAAVLRLCDVAVTLDTGPMHLARAVRLPMVIVAPAWSPAVEWLPLGNPRVRILKNAELDAAPEDYIIDEVSVAEVEQNLRELLAPYPPRQFTWRDAAGVRSSDRWA